MSRLATFVTVALLAATTAASADERAFDFHRLVSADATPASITHTADAWHLRGLVVGGITFSSTEYIDELEPDTMELTTTTSSMSPMIETGLRVGRELMDGTTVNAGAPKFTVIRGEVMPGNERHLSLLVGFSRRR